LLCELNRTGDLPDPLVATLEGLPNRVHARHVTVAGDARRVTFELQLESTAPLGAFADLVCRLSGIMGGQDVTYCVGRGGTLRIEPPGKLVTDESGRALSPLEALRKARQDDGGKD